MQGLHLTADLYRCHAEAPWLTDAAALGAWCAQAVEAVSLKPANQLFHTFPGNGGGTGDVGGVGVTVLTPESHVCVRTWPAQRAVTLDVYVCNLAGDQSAKARGLMFTLIHRFQPEWTEQRSMDRGGDDA
jgi:S-adenosylmethionine decarboxylase